MSLPAAWLALSHVGRTREQGSHSDARVDAQLDRLLRRSEPEHRQVHSIDDGDLQRRHLPGLSPETAPTSLARQTHGRRAGQRPLSPRHSVKAAASEISPSALATVSSALQPAARSDRARLETGTTACYPQPLLCDTHRSDRSHSSMLRSLATTELCTPASMLYYLSRHV
jgi:hypothetical protein